MVLWRPRRPSRTNTQKRCPFHYRGLECKSRKSRDTWSNRQVRPWSTKRSRTKAYRVLSRQHTGHSKHPLKTTEEKTLHTDITRWSILKSDWIYSLQPNMEKYSRQNKDQDWLCLRSWTPWVHQELNLQERLMAGGEGDDIRWDGWMATLTWWTWV